MLSAVHGHRGRHGTQTGDGGSSLEAGAGFGKTREEPISLALKAEEAQVRLEWGWTGEDSR